MSSATSGAYWSSSRRSFCFLNWKKKKRTKHETSSNFQLILDWRQKSFHGPRGLPGLALLLQAQLTPTPHTSHFLGSSTMNMPPSPVPRPLYLAGTTSSLFPVNSHTVFELPVKSSLPQEGTLHCPNYKNLITVFTARTLFIYVTD